MTQNQTEAIMWEMVLNLACFFVFFDILNNINTSIMDMYGYALKLKLLKWYRAYVIERV
jgi:hypothetical protein